MKIYFHIRGLEVKLVTHRHWAVSALTGVSATQFKKIPIRQCHSQTLDRVSHSE